MDSREEELTFYCSLYSSWDNISSSWKTVKDRDDSKLSLSLLMNTSQDKPRPDPAYVLLVVLSDQDVLHRVSLLPSEGLVTLVAGPASLLCMCGSGEKFRIELKKNTDVVKLFDTIKSCGLSDVKLMCLFSWQKEIIHEKIIEFLSGGGIPELSQKCDGEPRAELLMETLRKIFDEIVSKKPKIKALLKSKVDESFSLLDE